MRASSVLTDPNVSCRHQQQRNRMLRHLRYEISPRSRDIHVGHAQSVEKAVLMDVLAVAKEIVMGVRTGQSLNAKNGIAADRMPARD